MKSLQIAAQMYTVRDAAARDFENTLERIAGMGYTGVELAGIFDRNPQKLANFFTDLSLRCVSGHVPLDDLKNRLNQQIDTHLALGATYLVCPWLPPDERGDETGYRSLATLLNRIGEQCRVNGLQLCYHHHDFELQKFSNKTALDILLEDTSPENVQLEADTYWLAYGGEDPTAYVAKWAGRVPLLHVKDMSATPPHTFAEVGTGTLDWTSILNGARMGGTSWCIVEQDTCPGDPFESLKISLDNLRRLLD
jgi:sugar phosphate isomerase/epimerase